MQKESTTEISWLVHVFVTNFKNIFCLLSLKLIEEQLHGI